MYYSFLWFLRTGFCFGGFFVICAIYTVMCNTQNTYQRFNRLHELSEQAPQSEMITTVLMFVLIVKY